MSRAIARVSPGKVAVAAMFLRALAHGLALALCLSLSLSLTTETGAQMSAGGHDPALSWRTLETQHFAIHFPERYHALALQVAGICEELYQPMCISFNYQPPKTDVVLCTERDDAGGFMAIIPLRMEILIAEPHLALWGDRDTYLREVIAHEFTHVLQTKHRGFSSWSRVFLGELNSVWMGLAPGWYREGLPTYNETHYSAGGRGRNPSHYMEMMAPLAADHAWLFGNLDYPSRKRQPAGMEYVAGYYMADHIARMEAAEDSSGRRKSGWLWRSILDRYYSRPYLGFTRAVRAETGKSPGQIYQEELARFSAQARIMESAPLDSALGAAAPTLPLGSEPAAALGAAGGGTPEADLWRWGDARVWRHADLPELQYAPRWVGPDSLAFYVAGWDEWPQIVQMDRTGRSARILQRYVSGASNSFAIDPERVVWAEYVYDPRWTARRESRLVCVDRRSGERRTLAHGARLSSPDLSPGGDEVVAVEHTVPGYRLVRIDLRDGAVRPLLAVADASCLNPRWSPDGRRVAFTLKNASGSLDIALLDVASGAWHTLGPPDVYTDDTPCWTPDGSQVLFTSARAGTFSIWAAEVETGQRRLVSIEPLGAFSPAVSPDGKELAVSRYGDGGYRVVTMPLEPSAWIPEEQIPLEDNPFLFQYESGLPDQEGERARPQGARGARANAAGGGAGGRRGPAAQGPNPDGPALLSTHVHNYRPIPQVLLPRGWLPFVYEDEGGISPALYLLSADALQQHRWYGYFAISPQGAPGSFDFQYEVDAWWPRIGLRAYATPDRVGSGAAESWWRERGGSLRASLPLVLENNVYSSALRPYLAITGENEEASEGPLRPARSQYRGYQVGASFSRLSRTVRDLAYHKGIALGAFHEHSMDRWGSDYDAYRTNLRATLYVPALARHHTLAVTTTYELERGNYNYPSGGSIPLGHHHWARDHELRLYTAYHVPLAYIEWKAPWLPVMVDYLSGAVFHDWGTSWSQGSLGEAARSHKSYSSGVSLHLQLLLFTQLAASLNLAGYYQAQDDEWRLDAGVGLPGLF
jgi:hypothetical protein